MTELDYKIRKYAKRFCKRNEISARYAAEVEKDVERAFLAAYHLCLHQNKEENIKLQKRIEGMKNCRNCKSWDSQNLNFCEKGKRMCGYEACEEWELAE